MSRPTPSARIALDLSNPGQFFGCCGLLELAHRQWPGAQGWFDRASSFCFLVPGRAGDALPELLRRISACTLDQFDPDDSRKSALWLGAPFNLRLDWWLDTIAGGDTFRTWSGQQKGPEVADQMRLALVQCVDMADELFDRDVFVSKRDAPGSAIAPFYFDSRRQPKSLDVGFSPDVQEMAVVTYPAVEFLCLVGLQRFRPTPLGDAPATRYRYCAWSEPLEPSVASLACAGLLDPVPVQQFSFSLIQRVEDQAYYAFSQATPERSIS